METFYSREELEQIGFCSIGEDVKISKKTSIFGAENIRIGNHVRIDDYVYLSGNITFGNYIHISTGVVLYGGSFGIEFMDYSGLACRCAIHAHSDDYLGFFMTNPTLPEECRVVEGAKVVIGKYVIVGSGTTILPGVSIGEGTSVGAMSLVRKSLKPWSVYTGNPCKRITYRRKDMLEYLKNIEMN